jgi:hypothetical protein
MKRRGKGRVEVRGNARDELFEIETGHGPDRERARRKLKFNKINSE